jgi:antitoxin component of MazEF toxin-antitoxin module
VFRDRLRKIGDEFVVTIPKKEVERLGLREGQLLSLEIESVNIRPGVSAEAAPAGDSSGAQE